MFKNKILLVTGGTGSFGNSIVKRFLSTNIDEIRVFSRDEKKQEEMRLSLNDDRVKFYIGDVRDQSSISQATRRVNYIFHAAALKQVPSCEFYPMEAIKTNILGTENVMEAALNNGVERVILLSTDKAVYPINVMGMSKAMAEKIMQAKGISLPTDCPTIFCATRYGNVMASRGSVIPLFLKQIADKKPLTITDPEMTRFLMSLEESVDLVLYAFKNAKQGDIFVQKSPATTVGDLANALMELVGHKVGIKTIGTRHGEKLYETLISREEMIRTFDMGKFYRIAQDDRDLNYEKYFTSGEEEISKSYDFTSHNAERLSYDQLKNLLRSLEIVRGSCL